MNLKDFNGLIHAESKRPEIEYEDYEIIIAGHPGEYGLHLEAENITVHDNDKEIYIWI